MFDSQRNRATGTQSVVYYDRLWSTLSTKLNYLEINRVRFVVESIRELVGCTGLQILDLGCGRGWMAPYLSPLGSVTGVDFSLFGIQFAREKYGEHANFLQADADSPTLGLPAGSQFDVVVSSEVIEHVPEQLALLRQIAGFLRPGGWCILTTPNGNVWTQFSSDPKNRAHLQPVENWVTPEQVAALFRATGFRIVRHEGQPAYEFRSGLSGLLQRHRVRVLFRKLGLYHVYGRLVLPIALYQVVAAHKIRS